MAVLLSTHTKTFWKNSEYSNIFSNNTIDGVIHFGLAVATSNASKALLTVMGKAIERSVQSIKRHGPIVAKYSFKTTAYTIYYSFQAMKKATITGAIGLSIGMQFASTLAKQLSKKVEQGDEYKRRRNNAYNLLFIEAEQVVGDLWTKEHVLEKGHFKRGFEFKPGGSRAEIAYRGNIKTLADIKKKSTKSISTIEFDCNCVDANHKLPDHFEYKCDCDMKEKQIHIADHAPIQASPFTWKVVNYSIKNLEEIEEETVKFDTIFDELREQIDLKVENDEINEINEIEINPPPNLREKLDKYQFFSHHLILDSALNLWRPSKAKKENETDLFHRGSIEHYLYEIIGEAYKEVPELGQNLDKAIKLFQIKQSNKRKLLGKGYKTGGKKVDNPKALREQRIKRLEST